MRSMMVVGLLLLAVAACAPADEQYCQSFGVAGTPEFGKCMSYYHTQDEAFAADRFVCEQQADVTYPPTLYDHGHYEQVMGGFNHGVLYGGETVLVEPNYQRNAEVDLLRMRIIEPCMKARGWNSGSTWQAGRHAVSAAKPVKFSASAPTSQGLPWLGNEE
jgi:hypothetical protein